MHKVFTVKAELICTNHMITEGGGGGAQSQNLLQPLSSRLQLFLLALDF